MFHVLLVKEGNVNSTMYKIISVPNVHKGTCHIGWNER